MIRVLWVGNLISAVRGLILITNSAHETEGCPLNQLLWESQILQLHVAVIEVRTEPDMTAVPSKSLWLDEYLKSILVPSTSLSQRSLCSGMHSLRPSFSMCIFTPYDHGPAKTNRSNFIKDMRCSDPVISHDGALNVPPRTFYSLPKLRVQPLAVLPSVIEDRIGRFAARCAYLFTSNYRPQPSVSSKLI